MIEHLLLAVSIACLLACFMLMRAWAGRGLWVRVGIGAALAMLLPLGALTMLAASVSAYFGNRPQPEAVRHELFRGVVYQRLVWSEPRALIVHVIEVDPRAEGVRFLVTPGDDSGGREVRAQTTSDFRARHNLQVAFNGSFFTPFHVRGPFDFYPRRGDSVDVTGVAASDGELYSGPHAGHATLNFAADGEVTFGKPAEGWFNAISGLPLALERGTTLTAEAADLHPRSAVAWDRDRERVLLVAVDGRQPGYSEGVNLPELARLIQGLGGDVALNLDGGGSTALVIESVDGGTEQLNSPIHTRIPRRERPVANHLGVYAAPHPGGPGGALRAEPRAGETAATCRPLSPKVAFD